MSARGIKYDVRQTNAVNTVFAKAMKSNQTYPKILRMFKT